MAFIPLNAKATITPNGGASGAWQVNLLFSDATLQFSNLDIAVGQLIFTFDPTLGHVVAWQIDQVNGGTPPPAFGVVPLVVSYFDPRSSPSSEPVSGPLLDATGFICDRTPNEGLILISSWQLNVQEQRKAAEIENLNKLFILDISGPGGPGVFLDLNDTPASYGTAGQVVAVNGTETGLEFINAGVITPQNGWTAAPSPTKRSLTQNSTQQDVIDFCNTIVLDLISSGTFNA